MENKYLCFIKLVGKDIEDLYTYELLFTEEPDTFWGENFEFMPSCLCNGLIPNENDYDTIRTIKTDINLSLIQDSCCHSFQDCADGIIPIAYQSLEGLDEYPEDGRLILHYGITYNECEELLANKNIIFE